MDGSSNKSPAKPSGSLQQVQASRQMNGAPGLGREQAHRHGIGLSHRGSFKQGDLQK